MDFRCYLRTGYVIHAECISKSGWSKVSATDGLQLWRGLQVVRSLTEVNDALKHLMLQDLRIQCRARGISPAGSRPTLLERLAEHMMATGDL